MGLMDRIKKVTGTNDAYDEAYEDDYYGGFDGYNEGEDDSDMQIAGGANPSMNTGAGAPMNGGPMGGAGAAGGLSLSGNNVKMQVVRPQTFDSASQIADHLLNKCTVVLNLEDTNKETSRRLIDFLSGVAYSIDGSIKKVSTNAYVIAPSNVDVGDSQLKRRQNPQRQEEEAPKQPKTAVADDEDFNDFN